MNQFAGVACIAEGYYIEEDVDSSDCRNMDSSKEQGTHQQSLQNTAEGSEKNAGRLHKDSTEKSAKVCIGFDAREGIHSDHSDESIFLHAGTCDNNSTPYTR